ncbi:biotin-dependent carboxyltransferase family protein [Nocardioides sp. GCM10027113]|uniref:5-oxoprolinase subunit C family protein n=1 Tax=unclassified Nocardioides TaxID=2615069 RepID=UPI00361D5373
MTRDRLLRVEDPGPLCTVQDRGRTGLAHLGVPRGGPLDDVAADLANRLVGNPPDAALLEVTLGGLRATGRGGHWVAVTGAPGGVLVDGAPVAHGEPVWLPDGSRLEVGVPATGVRSYLAVAGGVDVPPVLGSRATDTLAWVGPPRVVAGAELPVGKPAGPPHPQETPRPRAAGPLRVAPGPRRDWFADDVIDRLCDTTWQVAPDSDRVGLRLGGEPLARRRDAGLPRELPSEGMVLGAVQVPPDGQPVVFLADHPPTGGYPVVAVVRREDLWVCGQLRPGESVRFTPDRPSPPGQQGRRAAATR